MSVDGGYDVELTPGAIGDAREIARYIREELRSPRAAEDTVGVVIGAAEALSTMPSRNRVLATACGVEVRRARAKGYHLLYFVEENRVTVFAVLHGTRDLEERLTGLLERL